MMFTGPEEGKAGAGGESGGKADTRQFNVHVPVIAKLETKNQSWYFLSALLTSTPF